MANFLEALVGEWFEYSGYFVRRNVLVGRRVAGGYETELDVVAYCPRRREIVHVEASTDTDNWARREFRYTKKFDAGRRYIPDLLSLPADHGIEISQRALFVYASGTNVKTVGGGRVWSIHEFMSEVKATLRQKKVATSAVPEQFSLVRAIQFSEQFGR